jgi:hypothetical protein
MTIHPTRFTQILDRSQPALDITRINYKIRAVAGAAPDQFEQPSGATDAWRRQSSRRERRNSPSRRRCRGLSEIRGFRLATPAANRDGDRPRGFGRERQPARRRHRKPRDLGDHRAETAVTDSFLETRQHGLLVAGIDVDDAVGVETDLGQGRREKVLPRDAPEHLALGSRRDARGEQGGRGAVDGGVATSRHFVQRPERQPSAREAPVDGLDAERKHRPGTQRRALKTLYLLAKPQDGGWRDRSTHALFERFPDKFVLDLFVSLGKSQSAVSVPHRWVRAKICGSRCEHGGNHGV